jgi:hypothetical protein
VDESYDFGNETIGSKNLVIYLKPLVTQNNRSTEVSVLFGGADHSTASTATRAALYLDIYL